MCVFQATEEGSETVACYSVCVTLVEGEETANSRWSVQRKLTEFQMLHRKLTEVTRNVGKKIFIYIDTIEYRNIMFL